MGGETQGQVTRGKVRTIPAQAMGRGKARRGGDLGIIGGTRRLDDPWVRERVEEARRFVERAARVGLEIGFGDGSFLASVAGAHPDVRFLGLEVRRKFVEDALARVERFGLDNVMLVEGDARVLLPRILGPGSLQQVWILFPDPWWKPRHFKRRHLLTDDFLAALHGWLVPGGVLTIKTDVPSLFEFMEATVSRHGGFEPASGDAVVPPEGATTKRERRCRHQGTPFQEMRWSRV